MHALLDNVVSHFEAVFGRAPEWLASAPGRANLIGEHVDHQEGCVLPAAINRYTVAAAAPNKDHVFRLWSAPMRDHPIIHPTARDDLQPVEGSWGNYVLGVIHAYQASGIHSGGFDMAFDSNLPIGAGMSSSASIEACTALVVEGLSGTSLSPNQRALLCQQAEHQFAGVPCGIMDQLTVNGGIDGHALAIDCRTLTIEPHQIPEDLGLLVIDSQVRHALADGEYAKRKADCQHASETLGIPLLRDASLPLLMSRKAGLGERVFRRAHHVVTEINRVTAFQEAMRNADRERMGILLTESHRSLRDDFEVSCPELDLLVAIAREHGAIGSRMMGGGFGGSTITLVSLHQADAIADRIGRAYRQATGKEAVCHLVRPVGGAAAHSLSPNNHLSLS